MSLDHDRYRIDSSCWISSFLGNSFPFSSSSARCILGCKLSRKWDEFVFERLKIHTAFYSIWWWDCLFLVIILVSSSRLSVRHLQLWKQCTHLNRIDRELSKEWAFSIQIYPDYNTICLYSGSNFCSTKKISLPPNCTYKWNKL